MVEVSDLGNGGLDFLFPGADLPPAVGLGVSTYLA
jgi:hypothetical protein